MPLPSPQTLKITQPIVGGPLQVELTDLSGGGGVNLVRNSFVITTSSLTPNPAATVPPPSGTFQSSSSFITSSGSSIFSFVLISVKADHKCRFEMYQSATQRDADAGRSALLPPTGEHGLIVDVGLNDGETWELQPNPIAVTLPDLSPSGAVYWRITNLSTTSFTGAIQVTLTFISDVPIPDGGPLLGGEL